MQQNSKISSPYQQLKSLAYKTDLAILSFQGRIQDRGEYLFAESPSNPSHFWGNLLVMKSAPKHGDFEKWTKLFRAEFSHQPLVQHMTFGWDSDSGEPSELSAFLADGFDIEDSIVLTSRAVDLIPPKHVTPDLVVKPIHTDEEWEAAILNQVACRGGDFILDKYLLFKRIQMKKYRDMSLAGLGNWFGAFQNGLLVADCGVFIFDGVGRFQSVGTHPDYRRRGICGNLIFESARWACDEGYAKTLVMVADPEYHAAKVYESVGFKPTEKAMGVCKFPQQEWTKKVDI